MNENASSPVGHALKQDWNQSLKSLTRWAASRMSINGAGLWEQEVRDHITALEAELQQAREQLATEQQAREAADRLMHKAHRDHCAAERKLASKEDHIRRMDAALHRISLGAQNSGTSKEDLGREARNALTTPDTGEQSGCPYPHFKPADQSELERLRRENEGCRVYLDKKVRELGEEMMARAGAERQAQALRGLLQELWEEFQMQREQFSGHPVWQKYEDAELIQRLASQAPFDGVTLPPRPSCPTSATRTARGWTTTPIVRGPSSRRRGSAIGR